jgi:DNA polymerase
MTSLPPPPPLDLLPRGTRIPARLGYATVIPDLDFETRSEAGYVWSDVDQRWHPPVGAKKPGLPAVGAEPYAAHPTCRIVWMSYDLKDGRGRRRWRPGLPDPVDLLQYLAAGGEIEAWNVGFERWVWKHVCVPRLGWPAVADSQWRCAMAKARASSLPGSLDMAGKIMGLSIQKDARGAALMKRLSMPRQPTKADPRRWIDPIYDEAAVQAQAVAFEVEQCLARPDIATPRGQTAVARAVAKFIAERREELADTLAYGDYNETDIASEAEASSKLPDLEGEELAWWQAHERINQRGVHIDRAGVENCVAIVEAVLERYNGELLAITGIDAASKVQQLQGWLHAAGVHLDSLDEEAVEEALKRSDLPPQARRVLEIRAAAGSASVKKLYAMRNRLSSDDRLRDLYVYYGARTGRCVAMGENVRVRDAEGRVLDREIQDVRPDDEVWDGAAWVRHEGVVRSGEREVVSYDGVTATPEHLVYVDAETAITLAEACRRGARIFRGEAACPTAST